MRYTITLSILFVQYLFCPVRASAMPEDSVQNQSTRVPAHYLDQVDAKAQDLNASFSKKTTQYLQKLSRIEAKLIGALQPANAPAGGGLPAPQYQQLAIAMQNPDGARAASTYVPGLDTLATTLKFLQSGSASGLSGLAPAALVRTSGDIQQLQARLDESTIIQQYISQRKQELAQLISQYTHLPAGVTRQFAQYQATAYYYRQQVEQYKAILNDPGKMEQLAVSVLSRVPAYQAFLAKNSLLASLFHLPAGYGSSSSVQGLQTLNQVQQQLQKQVGGGGGEAVQQQLQAAQSEIAKMQSSLSKYGVGGQDLSLPDFKPNSQKTKTFFNRLEYGVNAQFIQSSTQFPATGNLGLTLGYKINDKSSAGVGLAYTIGLGSGWNHIVFSSQAIGLRSYMDWKIKNTWYVAGGYELNHLTSFGAVDQLYHWNAWQPSALIGLEKKYKISSKVQGTLQLLFDAFYRQEVPQGQAIKFRVGYTW
jgi:hypothetical protein